MRQKLPLSIGNVKNAPGDPRRGWTSVRSTDCDHPGRISSAKGILGRHDADHSTTRWKLYEASMKYEETTLAFRRLYPAFEAVEVSPAWQFGPPAPAAAR
jgi:hypothetical protein